MTQRKQPYDKDKNRSRSARVFVRLLPEEKQAFEKRCLESGLSQADYFRQKCLNGKPIRKRKNLNVEALELTRCLAQLGKIGSNLNQMAKETNMGYLPTNDELDIALVEHRQLMAKIRKALGYDY
ncbi:MAG: hypothetical protein Roseis2KO_53720 [Roseivirga sp.]